MKINIIRGLKTILHFGPVSVWDSRDYLLKGQNPGNEVIKKIEERYYQGKCIQDLRISYYYHTGKDLNLEHPETFTEKIFWIGLYGSTPLKVLLADKYRAKEWIDHKLGAPYAVPLLGVWDSFDEIDFDSLPASFALKVNSGCKWNLFVRNRSEFDREKAKKDFDTWMGSNFAFVRSYQMQYLPIKPKILAEECLPPFMKGSNEYKFLCFNGRVDSIYVFNKPIIDGKEVYTTTMYSRDWKRLDWVTDAGWPNDPEERERPSCLEEMITVAEKLSEDIDFVRVDLYEVSGRIYVGEMTFTPAGGFFDLSSREEDKRLGDLINLKNKEEIKRR